MGVPKRNESSSWRRTLHLLGVGLGLQLRLGERFTGRIEYGVPLIDAGNSDGNTWQEKGLYFSVIYTLNNQQCGIVSINFRVDTSSGSLWLIELIKLLKKVIMV